jgi:hypothetical protein
MDCAMHRYTIDTLNRDMVSVSLARSEVIKIAKSKSYVDLFFGPLEPGGK